MDAEPGQTHYPMGHDSDPRPPCRRDVHPIRAVETARTGGPGGRGPPGLCRVRRTSGGVLPRPAHHPGGAGGGLSGTHRGSWPGEVEVVFHHQKLRGSPGCGPCPGRILRSFSAVLEKREKPWGTAHALLTARPHLPHPFVLLNADDFYGDRLSERASEFLAEPPRGSAHIPTFGLVTYTLGETLSEHGGVSRGVCRGGRRGLADGDPGDSGDMAGREAGLGGRTLSGQEVLL